MNNLITYLFELNLCLALFGLIYLVFFKNETDFKFRRYYILSAVVIAMMAPIFKFGASNVLKSSTVTELPYTILPELVIGNTPAQVAEYESVENNQFIIIDVIYIIVAIVLLQYFLFQLMQVFWFAMSNRKLIKRKYGVLWIETNGTLPTFSFFKLLFYDNSVKLDPDEEQRIIQHELAHIEQKHSLDILLLEIVKISSWFNPITWYLRSEIQDIHEYLADEKATTNNNTDDYSSLLAKMALNQANLSIGHHFNKSKTLKRIEMMKTIKSNVKKWKIAITIPMLISAAIIVSCNDEVAQDLDNVMKTANQTELPSSLAMKFSELQDKYPDADFDYMETDGTNKESLTKIKDLDPSSIAHIEVFKERGMVGIIFNKNGVFRSIENKLKDGEVFTVVDETAMPEGGYDAFYKRVAQNLQYPSQAKQSGIEGKVYVQMIINETGGFDDIKVVKGIGAGCDVAAMQAVKNSGSWSAPKQNGKAVKQRIILPITFSLGEGHDRGDNPDPANTMKVDAKVVDGYYVGKVLSDKAMPLPGVNIVIKGTDIGTVSDIKGEFKIKVNPKDEVVFSFIGKETFVLKMPAE